MAPTNWMRQFPWRGRGGEAARVGALLLAVIFATIGWRRLDARWKDFDTSLRWYGASLLLLIIAAVPPPSPARAKALWSRAASFCLRHRWEILAFGVVFALAIFMRVHQFGHFPPSDGTSYEEAQTGGLGYSILHHGERPVEFAVTDYTAAVGLALFGNNNITGLRLPFLLISIVSIVPLYLLLRLMVGAPAALFTAVLFAVNRWHATTSGIADETFLGSSLAILAALLLVVVLRTGNPVALIGLGLTTAGLAYEYTAYRHVAFLIVAALVAAVALRSGREMWLRRGKLVTVVAIVKDRWRLPVVFLLALAIAASPLIISSLHGNQVFIEAFKRHGAEHPRTAFFGLLPSDWPTRLKWVTEVFLPLGPRQYEDLAPLNLPGERMLDPVTASLALIAMAYALVTIHKPYRAFFAAWLFIGLFVGAVIPVHFIVSKFTGLLPPLFVLIAFMMHDVLRALPPRVPKMVAYMALVPLVIWASVVNLQVFHEQGNDAAVRREFNSTQVNLCNFAKGLGPDTYVYLWAETGPTEGLFGGSDFDWVCGDLKGQSLNSLLEVSPLEPEPEGNVAFVYLQVAEAQPDLTPPLARAYPTIDGPTQVRRPFFDSYTLRAFVVPRTDVARRQGLQAAYYAGDQTAALPLVSRLDPASLFIDGGEINWPAGSARVHWEGLVLTKEAGPLALETDVRAPLKVSVDGQVVYQSDGTEERATPVDLNAGWHTLQVDLGRTGVSRAPRLTWVIGAHVQSALVEEADLFAFSPLQGWTHTRSLDVAGVTKKWQRIDSGPAFGWSEVWLPDWLFAKAPPKPPVGHLLNEEWKSNVSVPAAGTYTAKLGVRSGTAVLLVDGAPAAVVASEPGQDATNATVLHLEQGEHRAELTFVNSGSGSVGVTLAIGGAGTEIVHFTPS